ncbi:hypothetical protein [Synechococcus sp. BMK-MC-1]|uniref:hypothetical protein n=1 Tax=Synechococcus sp. BMK-MC-1 TaxID=1442551 RepID=UPI0016452E10|nr:hypothetical protein [Synechococcus sp. BMK-MC-1]
MNGVHNKLYPFSEQKNPACCSLFDTKRKSACVESAFVHAVAPQRFETDFMSNGKSIQNMHIG